MASAQATARRTVVGAVVIGLHVIFALALIAGTAIRKVPQLAEFIDTRLIQAEDEPPPKEPPPPPPDFVPPPVAPPPTLDIPVVMGPPSETAIVIQKPEPAKPAAAPAPAPPPVTQAKIAPGVNLANLCPYPSASRRLGEAGSVVILFYVTANGRATEAKVESSSGFPRLDEAAVSCLRKGRYVASTVGGQAVDSWQRIRWTWKLED
jgi:periplasmic protein TonB